MFIFDFKDQLIWRISHGDNNTEILKDDSIDGPDDLVYPWILGYHTMRLVLCRWSPYLEHFLSLIFTIASATRPDIYLSWWNRWGCFSASVRPHSSWNSQGWRPEDTTLWSRLGIWIFLHLKTGTFWEKTEGKGSLLKGGQFLLLIHLQADIQFLYLLQCFFLYFVGDVLLLSNQPFGWTVTVEEAISRIQKQNELQIFVIGCHICLD